MRSDLSPAFLAAKNASFRRPRQLLVFHFASGPVYLSDQKITLGDKEYLPLVEEWGNLDTAGDSEVETGEIRQMAITLWNGGKEPFSDRFLIENPENVEVDLYQWFAGLADSDKALIDRFVIQDPINYGEASRLLTLDLVSLGMRYDAPIGDVLSTGDWPDALESDVNKGIDLIIGSPGQITTLCARTAPQATLTGSILLLPTIVNVHEDLDDLNFPESGKIQIDEEIMEFSERDSDSLTISTRGTDGTTASEHSDGATVIQHITDHTYLVGRELSEINAVMVGSKPAKEGTYTVDAVSVPARIIFNTKPSYTEFSKGARRVNLDFDADAPSNNAYQAYYSYTEEEKSNGALISQTNTPLAVLQNDPATDDGEVVRAFLSVEHWATDVYLNDSVEVWVDGLGVVGSLSRPNAADIAGFSADVDVDHGHDHATGGNHGHGYSDPELDTNNPSHDHSLQATRGRFKNGSPSDWKVSQSTWGGYKTARYSKVFYFYGLDPHVEASQISINIRTDTNGDPTYARLNFLKIQTASGDTLYFDEDGQYTGTYIVNAGSWNVAGSPYTWVKVEFELYTYTQAINVYVSNPTINYEAVVDSVDLKQTDVQASISSSGAVGSNTSAVKAVGDVDGLSTANRQLENIVTSSSSRSVVQKFDLTKHLESISWEWFTGREIQLRYVGSANDVSIIVTYINFEVEYRQRETIFTNDVTCSPVGSVGNRPDQVIQYLLNQIAGLPLSEILIDDAATRFAELGYQLDGVLPASSSVREDIKRICQQTRSRLIWEAGKAKLVVREKFDNWSNVRNLLPADLQQKSIRVHRQPLSNVVNDINLFYQKDHSLQSNDQTAYLATAKDSDQGSITKHGIKRDDDRFCFDLIANKAMAESLADFYIWLLGEPSSFYEFTGYLPQSDLEKEDIITLTSHGFAQIVRRPMVIRAVDRVFGSLKKEQINLCRILAEGIRHRLIEIRTEDMITLADDLGIEMDKEVSAADPMVFADLLTTYITTTCEDQASFSDDLSTIFNVNKTTSENLGISDVMSCEMVITTEDQITMADQSFLALEQGFGAGGFGKTPFGAIINHSGSATDEMGVTDSMATEQTTTNDDDLSMSDKLITCSGFGSPLGDGFGIVPFGS